MLVLSQISETEFRVKQKRIYCFEAMLSQISETEFQVKQKRIYCFEADGDTMSSCPEKLCVLTQEDLVRSLIAIAQRWEEKAMTPHSSTLAWKIPWTEEPGRLQFMGSERVGHD